MIAGREPLTSIEKELVGERRTVEDLDRRISDGSARRIALSKEQAQAYRELARLRVGSLAAGTAVADSVARELDAVEERVTALLRAREGSAQELAQRLADAETRRTATQAERAEAAARLEAAAAAVDAAEARTQDRLEAEPAYQAQLERAHEAERVALHAEEKATRSEQELEEKGRAYRQDPLFMYLWRRGFASERYRAAPLFRWLDGVVARHAGFLDARLDYARLQEIPLRLREHASARRQLAETEFAALRELDEAARASDGIPALEAIEERERAALAEVDARLEQLAGQVQALLDERQRHAAGEDEPYQQAIELLATGLRSQELRTLYRDAAATPFPEDDVLIARLEQLNDEQQRLEAAGQELQAALQQRRDHVRELETLQAEFKRRQYDQPGHGFEDGALVATVLANVLSGMLDRNALWRVLDQQRRYRPPRSSPTFGSGGFGRGTPWGGGGRPRGGSGSRGGGFRTGGKF